jgi:rare lipoprotein A (peptidoglycan hydrolase)
MLRRKFKYFVLTLILTAFTSANADVDLHEGMWEITSKIEMSGIPVQIPDTTISQCISKEKIIPKTNKKVNEHCTVSEQKIEGNTVTWKMKCAGKMESQGSITYHGDTFEGLITSQTEIPNMGMMTMTIQMTGKRTGECN